MELEFVNRNVDLQILFESIEHDFVIAKGFKILRRELGSSYLFLAFNCPDVPGVIKIVVEGAPEKFSVNFYLRHDRLLSFISYLGIPFGTGYLYLRGVKKMENFKKLEKEFYEFLLRTIVSLEGSASKSV